MNNIADFDYIRFITNHYCNENRKKFRLMLVTSERSHPFEWKLNSNGKRPLCVPNGGEGLHLVIVDDKRREWNRLSNRLLRTTTERADYSEMNTDFREPIYGAFWIWADLR